MPRTAKGTIFRSDGALYARVVIAPKKYTARALTWLAPEDDAAAHAWATTLQELATTLRRLGRSGDVLAALDTSVRVGRDDPEHGLERVRKSLAALRAESIPASAPVATTRPGAVTFQKFAEAWTSGRLHKEYPDHVPLKRSAGDDARRLEKHVYPLLGHVPLAEITLKHAQDVMRRLPSDLSSATRRQIAQLLARVLKLAVYPAELIKASPLPAGFLPKVRTRKGRYLYPDEDATLLGCTKPEVPLGYRVLWGFLAREGMRKDEALSMTWGDLDLERGRVALDENKTDDPRAWALDAGVARALKAWRGLLGKPSARAKVFAVVDHTHLPEDLRGHLRAAGVEREELYAETATHRSMNVHGLRATFVTVSLANGKTETWVMDRTGHRSSQMVNTYRRPARTWNELDLGALLPLDEAIPELRRCREGAGAGQKKRPRTARKVRVSRVVGRVGHDPTTYGLKVRSSTN